MHFGIGTDSMKGVKGAYTSKSYLGYSGYGNGSVWTAGKKV